MHFYYFNKMDYLYRMFIKEFKNKIDETSIQHSSNDYVCQLTIF